MGVVFDSPKIFLQQFGLQVVAASTRANFSARSIFYLRVHCIKRCAP
jgi:hypothetical protein